MNAPRYRTDEGMDRDADAVPSLLEDALGRRIDRSRGCVRSMAGETDPQDAALIGLEPLESVLPSVPLSNYGYASPAQLQAREAANAVQRASHLAPGMGDPTGFDFSGKAPTTFKKTPGAGAGAGAGTAAVKHVQCARCGRLHAVNEMPASTGTGLPIWPTAGGAVVGALLFGPVGALVGGGLGYLLGR